MESFDQFIARMLGAAPSVQQPTTPPPMQQPAPFTPAPPVPYGNTQNVAQPANRQAMLNQAAQAAQGLSPDVVRMIAQAAQQSAQQQQKSPQVRMPQIDPRLASVAPTQGAAPVSLADLRAQEEEKPQEYVMVSYDSPVGPLMFYTPEDMAKNLPEGARVTDAPSVTADSQQYQAATMQGMTFEQQPESIQGAFRTQTQATQDDANLQIVEEGGTPGPDPNDYTTGPAEMTPQQATETYQQQNPYSVEDPITMTVEEVAEYNAPLAGWMQKAGVETYSTDQVPVIDPQTGQVSFVTEQELIEQDMFMPVEMFTYLFDDPNGAEARQFVAQLKNSGIDSMRESDIPWVFDHPTEEGKLWIMPPAQREGVDNPMVPKDPITPEHVRQYNETLANDMLRQEIYTVPDGQMVVRDQAGTLSVVPYAETAPEGTTIEVYGGLARPVNDEIIGGVDDFVRGAGVPILTKMGILDEPRQWNAAREGEDVYNEIVSGKLDPDSTLDNVMLGVQEFTGQIAPTGWVTGDPEVNLRKWAMDNPDAVREAYENGYVDPETGQRFTGGQGVWEAFVSTQNKWDRARYDMAMDPLNWLPVVGGIATSVGGRIARSGAPLGLRVLGQGVRLTGRAAQLPDELPGRVFGGIRNSFGAGPRVPGIADNVLGDIIGDPAVARSQFDNMDVPSFFETLAEPNRWTPIGDKLPDPRMRLNPTRLISPTVKTIQDRAIRPIAEAISELQENVRIDGQRRGPDPRDPGAPTGDVPRGPNEPRSPLSGTPLGREATETTGDVLPPAREVQADAETAVARAYPEQEKVITRADQAVYENVQNGNIPVNTILPDDVLQRNAYGVLPPLPLDRARQMTPAQIMVYEGLRIGDGMRLGYAGPADLLDTNRAARQTRRETEAQLDTILGREPDAPVEPILDPQGQPIRSEDLPPVESPRRPVDVARERASVSERLNRVLSQTRDDTGLIVPGTRRAATTPAEPTALEGTPLGQPRRDALTDAPQPGPLQPQEPTIEQAPLRDVPQEAPVDTTGSTTTVGPEAVTTSDPYPLSDTNTIHRELMRSRRGFDPANPSDPAAARMRAVRLGMNHRAGSTNMEDVQRYIDWLDRNFDTSPTALGDDIPARSATEQAAPEAAPPREPSMIEDRPEWSFATPDESRIATPRSRIIERARQSTQDNPDAWRQFVEAHDTRARQYIDDQAQLRDASIRQRERGERQGWDYEHSRQEAITEAEYVLDLVDDYNRTIGAATGTRIGPEDYAFHVDVRNAPDNVRGRDSVLIEQAVFGSGGEQTRAMNVLASRAKRDAQTAAVYQRVLQARRRWEQTVLGQQDMFTPTPTTAQAPAAQAAPTPQGEPVPTPQGGQLMRFGDTEMGEVPISELRTTRTMTDEQIAEAGLPLRDFQNRTADYAEETVTDMVNNYNPALMRPVQAVRGNDGNLYILDGHSRVEAYRRMGRTDVPVQVVQANPEEIANAARFVNVAGTTNNPIDRGRNAQQALDAGQSHAEIASTMKTSTSKVRQYLDVQHIDPTTELGRAVNNGNMPLNKAAPIGRAIRDERLSAQEADRFYRQIITSDMKISDVEDEITALYRLKEEAGNDALGLGVLESDRYVLARQAAQENRRQLRSLECQRTQFRGVEKQVSLSREQRSRLADIDREIDRLRREAGSIEDETREAFFAGGRQAEPEPSVALNDLLRPMTEADSQARRVSLEAQSMDLGEAGRPVMQGGRTGTPGESLDADDLLEQPERSAADVMRDSGAQPLFFQNDPRRTAEDWYRRSEEAFDRATGANMPPKPNVFLSESTTPVTDRDRVWGVAMADDHYRELGNSRFSDNNESVLERLRRYTDEIADENPDMPIEEVRSMAGNRALHDWGVETIRRHNPKRLAVYEREYDRLMEKANANQWDAQREAMEKAMGRERPVNWYDTYLGIIRENKLYNPITGSRYIATQAVGNTITALLVLGPVRGSRVALQAARDFFPTYRQISGGLGTEDFLDNISGTDVAKAFNAEEIANPGATMTRMDRQMAEYGLTGHEDVFRLVREDTALGERYRGSESTRLAKWVNDMRLGRLRFKPGKVTDEAREEALSQTERVTGTIASKTVRDVANTFDMTYRLALWSEVMSANVASVRNEFRDQMRRNLPQNADMQRFDELFDAMPDDFGPRRIRENFDEFGTNYADRMARDWQNSIRKMDKNAREEVRRVFFSGEETNADAFLRRVFMFHYWASRATPLYTEALMRNPGLLNAYVKLIEETKEQAESGQYGTAVSGLLKVFDSLMGYNIFIRPDAMLQTVASVVDTDKMTDDEASGVWKFMNRVGLMPSPAVDAFLNLTGYQGQNTFTPDLLGMSAHFTFGNAIVDGLKSYMGMDVSEPTSIGPDVLWSRARAAVSGELFGSTKVDERPSTSYSQVEIQNNLLDIAEERGLDWDDPVDKAVIIGAMNDPDSDLYRAAFRRYANSNLIEWGFRIVPITAVTYPKLRQASADERRYTINTAPRDSEERQTALNQREAATAGSSESRTLQAQADEYQNLGTDEQQEAYRQYNAIRFGGLGGTITVQGREIGERQLRAMSTDDRTAVADAWAEENGLTEDIDVARQLRADYRESHPEYKAYYDWSMEARDYDGGPVAYWQALIGGENPPNPNAERWYRATLNENLPAHDLEQKLTGTEAYMAWGGIRRQQYDPSVISTRDSSAVPYSPTEGTGETGSGFGGSDTARSTTDAEGIEQDIADYQQEVADVDAQLKALLGPDATWAAIENQNPMARNALMQHVRDAGITPPRLSRRAQAYLEWAEDQPEGSDITITAYLDWREKNKPQEDSDTGGSVNVDDLLGILNQ